MFWNNVTLSMSLVDNDSVSDG